MAIVKPSTILEPFATNGDLVSPPAVASTTVANQDTGFPLLQSTPIGAGGLPVNREQMNGVFNLYSQFAFWQQCGGTYTFDAAISAQYSGYPAGIVLWCASNRSFQLSLVNNNTANFVTTPSYIDDGVNWAQVTYPVSNGQAVYTTIGAHSFVVPIETGSVLISAIGPGGGGGAGLSTTNVAVAGGGGGGSGDFIYKKAYPVVPGETITITIQGGGAGATAGSGSTGGTGGTTVIIGSFGTISMAGGQGGNPAAGFLGDGGAGGGINGIHGGAANSIQNGAGLGTNTYLLAGGTGGTGFLGGAGTGAPTNSSLDGNAGKFGSGGGGGAAENNIASFGNGGPGGAGAVIIDWGIRIIGT